MEDFKYHTDKDSLELMKKWNLENLEYIIQNLSLNVFKTPYWYLYLPKDYDGIVEALLALTLEDDMVDSIDASFNLISIEENSNAKKILLSRIAEMKIKQQTLGLKNILAINYVKYCELIKNNSKNPHIIISIAHERKIVCSNPTTLKSVYGENWRKYYRAA